MQIALSKEQIDMLFEKHEDAPIKVIEDLYALVVPNFFTDKTPLKHWPKISRETWMYICHKFIEANKKTGNDNLQFIWMNVGFTSDNSDDEKLPDWVIETTKFDLLNCIAR
jgi:hypothetical protein